jgi:hypothetical protein
MDILLIIILVFMVTFTMFGVINILIQINNLPDDETINEKQ